MNNGLLINDAAIAKIYLDQWRRLRDAKSDFPKDLSVVPSDGPDVFTRGGTVIVAPDGEIVAGPLFDEEGTVIADCDLGRTVRAKYGFDAVGHYSREDVLLGALANGNTVAESSAALSLED